MINILVIKNKQNIITIEATGHSGYAEEGKDIVCSAVSTLMQNLALGLTEVIKISPEIMIDENIPHMYIHINVESLTKDNLKYAQMLMQTTVLSLKEIANGYSKYIKLKEKQND